MQAVNSLARAEHAFGGIGACVAVVCLDGADASFAAGGTCTKRGRTKIAGGAAFAAKLSIERPDGTINGLLVCCARTASALEAIEILLPVEMPLFQMLL